MIFGLRSGRIAGVFCCLWLLSSTAAAQSKMLEIEQSGMQPSVQMGRPVPSWWDVKIRGSALVEGRFVLQLKNDTRLLTTMTTEDLTLTGPQQRIRILLPPITDQMAIDQLRVDIHFKGKRFDQDLGTHILRVAMSRARTFMVLTSMSRLAPKRSAGRDAIVKRLAFESLVTGVEETVKTVHASLDPSDMPQEPLTYCAYEMTLLFGDEFRLLKKPQLDALVAWVRAGGSLYIEPIGVLEQYHVDFLRKLAEFGPKDMVIQPDSKGRLVPGSIWNDERLILLKNGLGRVVMRIDDEGTEEIENSPVWREASAFLWRWHVDQIKLVKLQTIPIGVLLQNSLSPRIDPYAGYATSGGRLSLKQPPTSSVLVDWLMPDGVRMVPLWVLGLILTSFVVWIGPVDYFGLGRLQARKFTWITFPLATFLVTGLTVWITNRYMSAAETRRGMVICDVGGDGAIVRTNRFELLFIASTRQISTDVRKGVFSALSTGQSISNDPYQQQMLAGRNRLRQNYSDRAPARMSGRVPTEFTVSQDLAKWTPQLNRTFWIPGATDESPIDWQSLVEGISMTDIATIGTIPDELQARVQKQFGSKALVAVLADQNQCATHPRANWTINGREFHTHTMGRYHDEDSWYNFLPSNLQQRPLLLRWLYSQSAASRYGLFSVTSQVGPTGGAELDDLPILDTSDPNQRLLLVLVPKGDDLIVYRKLLHTER